MILADTAKHDTTIEVIGEVDGRIRSFYCGRGTLLGGATPYVRGSDFCTGVCDEVVGHRSGFFSMNMFKTRTRTTAIAAAINSVFHVLPSARLKPSATETGVLIRRGESCSMQDLLSYPACLPQSPLTDAVWLPGAGNSHLRPAG